MLIVSGQSRGISPLQGVSWLPDIFSGGLRGGTLRKGFKVPSGALRGSTLKSPGGGGLKGGYLKVTLRGGLRGVLRSPEGGA